MNTINTIDISDTWKAIRKVQIVCSLCTKNEILLDFGEGGGGGLGNITTVIPLFEGFQKGSVT